MKWVGKAGSISTMVRRKNQCPLWVRGILPGQTGGDLVTPGLPQAALSSLSSLSGQEAKCTVESEPSGRTTILKTKDNYYISSQSHFLKLGLGVSRPIVVQRLPSKSSISNLSVS